MSAAGTAGHPGAEWGGRGVPPAASGVKPPPGLPGALVSGVLLAGNNEQCWRCFPGGGCDSPGSSGGKIKLFVPACKRLAPLCPVVLYGGALASIWSVALQPLGLYTAGRKKIIFSTRDGEFASMPEVEAVGVPVVPSWAYACGSEPLSCGRCTGAGGRLAWGRREASKWQR